MHADLASNLRASLLEIVKEAGNYLLDQFESLGEHDVERKGAVDLVTRVDRRAQAILLDGLTARFPGEPIIAEEGEARSAPAEGPVWVVDPLDGTTNFVHGVPIFAISVARLRGSSIELGMVYAPYLRECFWAAEECGAELNGRRLQVSHRRNLEDALLATGFPYDIRSNPHNNLIQWVDLAKRCRGLRRCGAASLDLAYVAAGRYDGYWEYRLKPWDLAAGCLLVQEAGGRVGNIDGRADYLWQGDVLATNGDLHLALGQNLRRLRTE